MSKIITFDIIRMDPLGQGVSLENDKVTFIPKTLPGEKGSAQILETKGKKVQFAKLEQISQQSTERTASPCPHVEECNGCSFLHTSYEKEIEFKKEAYAFLFKKIIEKERIVFHPAPERLHYRNRIQLHYDGNKVGFLNREGIHDIRHCKLSQPPIEEELQFIYSQELENYLPKGSPEKGHFEISLNTKGEKEVHFNQRYAAGGFRQVNESLSKKAAQSIANFLKAFLDDKTLIVDLFGGNGFLSEFYSGPKLIVDRGDQQNLDANLQFLDLNVYEKFAANKIEKTLKKLKWDQLERVYIIDPPRSGLKNIQEFLQSPTIKAVSYLSCNPHSQIRDLQNLENWETNSVEFFDFFPATHHLETLTNLNKG